METEHAALREALIAASERLLQRAHPLFDAAGVAPPEPRYRFDLGGRAAGQVVWSQRRRPDVRYNLSIAALQPEPFLAETVPHEIAHVVTALCHRSARPHGPEWRAVMAYFGIARASRCHRFRLDTDLQRVQRRWAYRCACDVHQLSTTRHNRVHTGRQIYVCRRCGGALHPVGGD